MGRTLLQEKVCRRCFKLKKREDFSPQRKGGIKIQSVCRKCSSFLRREWGKEWLKKHPERNTEMVRNYRRNLRRKVLEKFEAKCNRCGFSDVRALQIDHVQGGGYRERVLLGHKSGVRFHLMVLKDTKNKYQLLCANCNWIKKSENNET